ncbi:IS66 family insertion sequence element accessory protein TnpA [Pelomicrobium sp.]|uniref:IS66 family insertion sequence element accessory protein TnpA n=1 Tax=Pelomicrobium sp. TaxID=2815319 RepID=UPI003FA73D80
MRSSSRVRPHKSPAQRAEILAAYRQTALSSHAFARQHGVAPSTLFRWLREASAPRPPRGAALIEVPNLLAPPPAALAYRLCFANGVSVEVASGFEPEEVRTLARLIRSL